MSTDWLMLGIMDFIGLGGRFLNCMVDTIAKRRTCSWRQLTGAGKQWDWLKVWFPYQSRFCLISSYVIYWQSVAQYFLHQQNRVVKFLRCQAGLTMGQLLGIRSSLRTGFLLVTNRLSANISGKKSRNVPSPRVCEVAPIRSVTNL